MLSGESCVEGATDGEVQVCGGTGDMPGETGAEIRPDGDGERRGDGVFETPSASKRAMASSSGGVGAWEGQARVAVLVSAPGADAQAGPPCMCQLTCPRAPAAV